MTERTSRASRRHFLNVSSQCGIAAALGGFLHRLAYAHESHVIPGYGALRPVADETTGLKLLRLPEGFRYRSFGWTGDAMADGSPTPAAHDGMGVVGQDGDVVTLIRNHELTSGEPFGRERMRFDRVAAGGCSTLRFDLRAGNWLDARPSLAGTVKNCAGGPTPWGTWLSCEETVFGPGDRDEGRPLGFEQDHGWIFEVPADGVSEPTPLKAMGRFVHEAVAVDPDTGIVYETEDRGLAGFYRFLPVESGQLSAGGRLQMLKAVGGDDLRTGLRVGQEFDVEWVDIEDPERRHSPESLRGSDAEGDALGVFHQGRQQGGSTFARLEGCWYGNGLIYFDATSGGDAGCGQLFQYDPRDERLTLIFESPSATVLDSPDNITVSPRGGIVLCEDGDAVPHRMHGMTPEGRLFSFAENNVVLRGERHGYAGDFRDQEWAGATFSPNGEWLFVNIQTPGITFAITGPWGDGLL